MKAFRVFPLYIIGSGKIPSFSLSILALGLGKVPVSPPPSNTACWQSTELSELCLPYGLLRLWDLEKFQASTSFVYSLLAKHQAKRGAKCHSSNCLLHIGAGAWKNSELPPPYRLWDLGNSGLSCSLKRRRQAKHRAKRGEDMKYDLYFLARLINCLVTEVDQS